MKRSTLFAGLVLLLGAPASWADTTAYTVEPNDLEGCVRYEVCQNQAGTGTCTRSADEVVVSNVGYACVELDTMGSTSTYSLNLNVCRLGHDACPLANGVGFFASPLSESARIASGCSSFGDLFVEISANAGGSVDAWLTVCK